MVMTVMMMMTKVTMTKVTMTKETMTMINISIIELTLHLVGAIILPAIPDMIADELSGTRFPSKNEKCFYHFPKHISTNRYFFKHSGTRFPSKKYAFIILVSPSLTWRCTFYHFAKHILTNRFHHLLPGDAIRGVLAFELMSSVLARCLVLGQQNLFDYLKGKQWLTKAIP